MALKMCQRVDPDLFWQIKDGERVVREGRFPSQEEYSFTAAGRPMVAIEWLAETVTYGIFRVAGYGGLVIFHTILFLLTFAVLLGLARRHLSLDAGLCLLSLAAFAFLNFYAVRSQNWTFLFTALFLYWSDLCENGNPQFCWAMAAVLLPWANLHGGFMIGWVILALLCLRRSWETQRLKDLAPWGLGTLLCCMHPNGVTALIYPVWFMAVPPASRGMVLEWRPVNFGETSAVPYLLLLSLLLWFGLGGIPRRFPWAAMTLAWTVLALRGRKLLPEFTLFGIAALTFKLAARPSKIPRLALRAGGLAALSMTCWVVLSRASDLSFPNPARDFERAYPREAVEIIAGRYPGKKIFHNYDWGGYLIYKLYPRTRVFIDGRLDPYWRLFSGDYQTIIDERPGWKELLRDYGISIALLKPTDRLCEGLGQDPAWRILYSDARSVLFAR